MGSWRNVRLGDFLTLKRGYDLPTAKRAENGSVPIVSSAGIIGFHNEAMVAAPGVVTGRYGTVGAFFYINEPFWPLNTTLYVQDFKGNNELIAYYVLQSLDFKRYSGKTSVPGVNRNDLHKIKLKCPPLPEQHKIAKILSAWDEAIAKAEQLIAVLQCRKNRLMQCLLTGDVRFPAFIQSDWETFYLEDVTFESRTRAASESEVGLAVFGVNNQTGLTTDSKYSADNLDRYKVVKPGMFAYNPMRLNIGSIGYCDELLGKGLVSPDYIVFGCKEDKLVSKYFSFYVQGRHWKSWVRRAGAGSVRIRIYYKDISRYPIVLPAVLEQRKIVEVLQACDAEINLHTKKLEALRQQKKGLMQRLLTGQLLVKV
jgi:type I restriction enzyme S subunit